MLNFYKLRPASVRPSSSSAAFMYIYILILALDLDLDLIMVGGERPANVDDSCLQPLR